MRNRQNISQNLLNITNNLCLVFSRSEFYFDTATSCIVIKGNTRLDQWIHHKIRPALRPLELLLNVFVIEHTFRVWLSKFSWISVQVWNARSLCIQVLLTQFPIVVSSVSTYWSQTVRALLSVAFAEVWFVVEHSIRYLLESMVVPWTISTGTEFGWWFPPSGLLTELDCALPSVSAYWRSIVVPSTSTYWRSIARYPLSVLTEVDGGALYQYLLTSMVVPSISTYWSRRWCPLSVLTEVRWWMSSISTYWSLWWCPLWVRWCYCRCVRRLYLPDCSPEGQGHPGSVTCRWGTPEPPALSAKIKVRV